MPKDDAGAHLCTGLAGVFASVLASVRALPYCSGSCALGHGGVAGSAFESI